MNDEVVVDEAMYSAIPVYTVEQVEKDYEWCYSAKEFCRSLNALFNKKCIRKMFVSAENHSSPLRVRAHYINYLGDPRVLLQIGDRLVDLLIYAQGLFQWRVFEKEEYAIHGPLEKPIKNDHRALCDVGDGYGMFAAGYCDCAIERTEVEETDYWMLPVRGFDESRVGKPVELPSSVRFVLSNGQTLSLHGWDDDFVIKLLPSALE